MIVARIQGHPARAHLHEPLADSLGLPTEILLHSSDPPNPWLGYRACLSDLPACSHLLVIQDDTRVCANFAETIRYVTADVPVSLFLFNQPIRIAKALTRIMGKQPYYDARFRINEFCPVVGLLWPVEKAREFLAWVDENPRKLGHRNPRSDDSVVGKWCAHTHQTVRFTAPSLIDHLGTEPSVKGGPTPASGATAMYFQEDGLDYIRRYMPHSP